MPGAPVGRVSREKKLATAKTAANPAGISRPPVEANIASASRKSHAVVYRDGLGPLKMYMLSLRRWEAWKLKAGQVSLAKGACSCAGVESMRYRCLAY